MKVTSKNYYERAGRIYIDARVNGKRVRFSTNYAFCPRNIAKVQKDYEALLMQHFNPHLNIRQKQDYSFAFFATTLLKQKEKLKPSSYSSISSVFKELIAFFGKLDIRNITRLEIDEFFASQKTSFNTQKRKKILLKEIFRLACEYDVLSKIPTFPKNTGEEPKDIKPFNLCEIKAILSQTSGSFQNMLCVAFFTGMRSGELFALTWEDIDFEKKIIFVNKTITKQGLLQSPKTKSSLREVDMLPIVESALKSQLAISEKNSRKSNVFTWNGDVIKGSHVFKQEWLETLNKANVENRVFYNTRHTFASLMLQNQEEPLWVAQMMGHKNLNITYAVYARYIARKNLKRAEFLNDFTLNAPSVSL